MTAPVGRYFGGRWPGKPRKPTAAFRHDEVLLIDPRTEPTAGWYVRVERHRPKRGRVCYGMRYYRAGGGEASIVGFYDDDPASLTRACEVMLRCGFDVEPRIRAAIDELKRKEST